MVSKHHYAMSLAKHSNHVYFLNPPQFKLGKNKTEINLVQDRLYVVTLSFPLPKFVKFKLRPLYDYVVKTALKKLSKHIDPEVLWNFDNNTYFKYESIFKECFKIFHPVDAYDFSAKNSEVKNYDICFAVSEDILKHITFSTKHFVNHGLNQSFCKNAELRLNKLDSNPTQTPITAGYVGNISIPYLDRKTLSITITNNPEVVFNFYGNFDKNDTFTKKLIESDNCIFHGKVKGDELYDKIVQHDVLLLCYKKQDGYFGDNSHKLIEYLSTGKTVISSHLSTYIKSTLFAQTVDHSNADYSQLFEDTIGNLSDLNSVKKQKERISFAMSCSYDNRVHEIDNLISNSMHSVKLD